MNQNIREAVDFLYGIPKFTKKNSLDHTKHLLRELGDPGSTCRVIHVAGSNGKGSVCSFLYHMLLSGGKTVGLFTSPHLVDIRERFQVNGTLCEEEIFLQAFLRVREAADELVRKREAYPTFFEFIFAMGMLIFEWTGVEYIVLETGLGGRLDATNSVVHPVLTVITSISLEHTEILGDTIEQIAGEKAGILKPQVPVVYDANCGAAADVIRAQAEALGCPGTAVTKEMCTICEIKNKFIDFSLSTAYDKETRWKIPFSAVYQVQNAALAITAFRVLQQSDASASAIDDFRMREGAACSEWPGRMQEVLPEVWFDGAHNTAGIAVFTEAVRELTKGDTYPPLLLFSMVREKDYVHSVECLTENVVWEQMAVTTIPNERGISFEKLQRIFEHDTDRPVSGYADYRQALSEMLAKKKEGQKLFCTGSLYFIGALMEAIKEEQND